MAAESTLMKALLENPPAPGFVPYSHLNRESDTLTVYFEGVPDYSERLSDHVTLYRSLDTHQVVGCRIKGISGLIEDLPNYIEVDHQDMQLSVIFLAYRGGANDRRVAEAVNALARSATEKNLVLHAAPV